MDYKGAGIVEEDSSPEKHMTVRYTDLIAPLIKATQEQEKTILNQEKINQELLKAKQDQEKTNQEQQKIIMVLMKRIEALEKK